MEEGLKTFKSQLDAERKKREVELTKELDLALEKIRKENETSIKKAKEESEKEKTKLKQKLEQELEQLQKTFEQKKTEHETVKLLILKRNFLENFSCRNQTTQN